MKLKPAKLAWGASALGYLVSAMPLPAHPGHDLNAAPLTHLLSSPDHLASLALGGAVLWLTGRFVQRQWPRRLLQGAGLVAVLSAAVILGSRN